jgi:hypothetical protein
METEQKPRIGIRVGEECPLCHTVRAQNVHRLKFQSISELVKDDDRWPKKHSSEIQMLCDAIESLFHDYEGAAWRIADALWMLARKWRHAPGIGEPTGMGAMLANHGLDKPTTGKGIAPKVRWAILSRDEYRCVCCGRGAPDVELHIDHIHPRSKGGSDFYGNLRTLCSECNIGKGAN